MFSFYKHHTSLIMYNSLPTVYVNTLGEFMIAAGEKSINDQHNHSKKLWNLLEYLITHRNKEISQSELTSLLWKENESLNPTGALKTLMHRVRNLLRELDYPMELIIQRRGTYSWNTNIPCVVDIDVFDQICKEASELTDPLLQLEKYRKAVSMYKGDFLPKSNTESWVIPMASYYHTLYLKTISSILSILMDSGRYDEAANVCWQALTIDQFSESLHCQLILSLYLSGNQQAALKQYETSINLFYKKLGVTPGKQLSGLYTEIVKTHKDCETDMDAIRQNLQETEKAEGAFFCEYEIFKNVYRLYVRISTRTERMTQLCLLTLTSPSGTPPELSVLNEAMDFLKECLHQHLRSSDIFCRYSVSQYLLMLPNTSLEDSKTAMKRALEYYEKQLQIHHLHIIPHHSLQSLTSV